MVSPQSVVASGPLVDQHHPSNTECEIYNLKFIAPVYQHPQLCV